MVEQKFTTSTSVIGQGSIEVNLAITAHPDLGWVFSHWEGDVSGITDTIDVEALPELSAIAVFVVGIAPVIVDRQIATSTDDCYCFNPGTIRLTKDKVFISECTNEMRSYFRFLNILIPQGVVITHAYLEVCACGLNDGRAIIDVYGIKQPNAATFSTVADADARPITTAHGDWDFVFPYFQTRWEGNTWHGKPPDGLELKDIIQEIVNQPEWLSGNALAIKMVSIPQGGNARTIWSWNGNPALAAKLHIEYKG